VGLWRYYCGIIRVLNCKPSFALHGLISFIGGVNGSVSLNTVEVLRHDPTDGSLYWEYADPPLPTNVCGCGVATVNQIEYSLILRQRCPAREADDDGEEKVA